MCVISSTATHQIAAVGLQSCFVAKTTLCSQAAGQRVGLAVVGRPLDVDQLCVHGLAVGMEFLDLEKSGALVTTGSHRFHVHCLIVLVLEDVSQLTELGERRPAGLGGAGARHTMTLALQVHALLQDLPQGGKVKVKQDFKASK